MNNYISFTNNILEQFNKQEVIELVDQADRMVSRHRSIFYVSHYVIDESGLTSARADSAYNEYAATEIYYKKNHICDFSSCNCRQYKKVGICIHIIGLRMHLYEHNETIPRQVKKILTNSYIAEMIEEKTQNMNSISQSKDFRKLTGIVVENDDQLMAKMYKESYLDALEESKNNIIELLTTKEENAPQTATIRESATINLTIKMSEDEDEVLIIQPRFVAGKVKAMVGDGAEFMKAYQNQSQSFWITSKRCIDFTTLSFDAFTEEIISYLPLLKLSQLDYYRRSKNSIAPEMAEIFFRICAKHKKAVDIEIVSATNKFKVTGVTILSEQYQLPFEMQKDEQNYNVEISKSAFMGLVVWNRIVLNIEKKQLFYQLRNEQFMLLNEAINLIKIKSALVDETDTKVEILPEVQEQFIQNIQNEVVDVSYGISIPKSDQIYPLHIAIKFDRLDGVSSALVEFSYGQTKFIPQLKKQEVQCYRNRQQEKLFLTRWEQLITMRVEKDGRYIFADGMEAQAAATEVFNQFKEPYITVLIDEKLKKLAVVQFDMPAHVTLLEGGLLNVSFDMDRIEYEELQQMMRQYKQKKRYIELKSGVIYDLESKRTQEILSVLDSVAEFEDERKADVRIPSYYMHDFVDMEAEYGALSIDSTVKNAIETIGSTQKSPQKVSKAHKEILRPYQLVGVYWMQQLAEYNLGGILADDMGLGKTLQAIALIQSMKKELDGPILIVAPKTLTYNWQNEFTKFAPNLNVTLIVESAAKRELQIANIGPQDIIITSYPLLAKDNAHYKNIIFSMMLIDEAQHIKNPTTQAAKAVKLIPAKTRYALTGTPLENNVVEVWSIFDFVMPGFLGKHRDFIDTVAKKIGSDQQQEAVTTLKKKISPFILRRLKKDVLTDLPDKITTPIYCEMESKQAAMYRHYLSQIKQEIVSELAEAGFQKSQIKILALLTRLRQVCVDPNLFIENYDGKSAKMESLLELLEEAISGGHKILVFSQFTSMLDLIAKRLEDSKIGYYYLSGQTAGKKRLEMVTEFNEQDANSVFLLSLKAGGTGLNLTSADIVIHVDPWWNPSVENQASDRAHRFGQENDVFVYELIVKNTIEEKILELKHKKAELFDALFNDESDTVFGKLTEKEILDLF